MHLSGRAQLIPSDNSSDVTGVEIAGALKNVLAIAAGIVEGMNLGNNSMAALVAQGCSEIRWLATKVSQNFMLVLHFFSATSLKKNVPSLMCPHILCFSCRHLLSSFFLLSVN